MNKSKTYYNVTDAAEYLGVSRRTVMKLVENKQLDYSHVTKKGKVPRFTEKNLLEFLQNKSCVTLQTVNNKVVSLEILMQALLKALKERWPTVR